MSHVRTQIRDALVTLLTGLTTTGANVFGQRLYALTETELPALIVSTEDESITVMDLGWPSDLRRELNIEVKGYAKQVSNIDDVLDQIALEVEGVVGASLASSTLGDLVKEQLLLTRLETSFDKAGEQPVGVVTLTFTAAYWTASDAPSVAT